MPNTGWVGVLYIIIFVNPCLSKTYTRPYIHPPSLLILEKLLTWTHPLYLSLLYLALMSRGCWPIFLKGRRVELILFSWGQLWVVLLLGAFFGYEYLPYHWGIPLSGPQMCYLNLVYWDLFTVPTPLDFYSQRCIIIKHP